MLRNSIASAVVVLVLVASAQAEHIIYSSPANVDVNGVTTPDLSAVATRTFGMSATFDATPGGGGGVVIDELGQPAANTGWHDSQIAVNQFGQVFAGFWAHPAVIYLGTASFGVSHQVSLTYDDATGQIVGSLDGNITLRSVAPGARQDPLGNAFKQYYAFGVADSTTLALNTSQAFAGSITNVTITAAPEPSSIILCGLGAVGLLIVARRRRKA